MNIFPKCEFRDLKPNLSHPLARQVARAASRGYGSAVSLLCLLPLWSSPAWAGNYTFTSVIDNTGQFSDFEAVAINNSGVVAFKGDMQSGVEGIYRTDGTTTTTIADTSSGEFSFYAGSTSLVSLPAIDDDGTVAFFIYTNYNPAIFTGSGGFTAAIVNSGDTNCPFYVAWDNPCIRNSEVSFSGQLRGSGGNPFGPQGVFTEPASGGGGYNTIAQDGGMFLSGSPFGGTSINAAGLVAYCGYLADGTEGLFVGPDGATNLAQTGPGSQFYSLDSFPKISDTGLVVFWATLTNYTEGDFISSNGIVTQISVPGGGLPDDQYPSINAAGTVACFGSDSAGQWAVLAGTGSVVDKVIAEGDSLFGSTVIGLGSPGNNGLNNNGQIVFPYSLANGVQGIAIATPANGPPPASPLLQIQQPDPLHVSLAWSTNAAAFGLEAASSLPASIWNPVTNTPVPNGQQFVVVLQIGSAPQFFRLRQQ